ncbi:MAG TPA: hypothetical protein PKB03_02835 [Baekduia sp.]|nr:hypothetical protein [Baekduia sp.]
MRAVVARERRHDDDAAIKLLRIDRDVARHPRPDRWVTFGYATERTGLRRGERHQRGRIRFARAASVVDFTAENDERAKPSGVGACCDACCVDDVGRAVGPGGRRGPNRTGEHNRRIGVVQNIAEHRRLFVTTTP